MSQAASNDKRFVIEETERACHTMAAKLDAAELIRLLLPYIKHKNAKVSSSSLQSRGSRLDMLPLCAAPLRTQPDIFLCCDTRRNRICDI